MNWKVFIAFSISGLLIAFPQNIVGCGGSIDPYDYYTSFFHQNLPDANGYRPFYYTGYSFLYDENEPADVSELLAREWADYCGKPVTAGDAKMFVNKFDKKDLGNLYLNIEKSQVHTLPDSVIRNSMTSYFIQSKDLEALGYLLYARKAEPFVIGNSDPWEPVVRDSMKMGGLLKNGLQLYAAAKKDFFKLRYAYQAVRLAHYSGRYTEAINLYDSYVSNNPTPGVLQPLSVALKGGALFRTGKTKEAAYLFSKAFNGSIAKRLSNYLGFNWSIHSKTPRKDYLALCKTNEEKASMLGLFALGNTADELGTMKEIYQLNPASEVLEILTVREVNKLEENYFTPSLQKEKGGSSFYSYWERDGANKASTVSAAEAKALVSFLTEAGNNQSVKNRGLFITAAAYTAYMVKDYSTAKKLLAAADKITLSQKVKDQWTLTNILITINEKQTIDAAFEQQLLPSLQWLELKVKKELPVNTGLYEVGQWRKIYRDLLSEILAGRYHQQGLYHKEALCIGAADMIAYPDTEEQFSKGIEFMRNKLEARDVEKLYALLTAKQLSNFDAHITGHNAIKIPLVADFAGTAYLREYDYPRAIGWFKKLTDKKTAVIIKNPFIDLLYDQEEQLPRESTFKITKQAFAETMLQLTQQAASDSLNAAKLYYKMANGLYNMTYYGHTWELVQYGRSGSDGYAIPKDAGKFQREYYGCFMAHDYFEKAMKASTDNNFRARCLFMMAKCSQKQVPKPTYSDFNNNYDQLEAAEKKYWTRFKNNRHFPALVKEYSNTSFYKEVYNSCSFLRDFVKKNN